MERWITIGQVKPGWYVLLWNAGYPDCLWMDWRGRVAWCQPSEFFNWTSLVAAVRQRLRLAGLEMRAVACGLERPDGYVGLRVLVGRWDGMEGDRDS